MGGPGFIQLELCVMQHINHHVGRKMCVLKSIQLPCLVDLLWELDEYEKEDIMEGEYSEEKNISEEADCDDDDAPGLDGDPNVMGEYVLQNVLFRFHFVSILISRVHTV